METKLVSTHTSSVPKVRTQEEHYYRHSFIVQLHPSLSCDNSEKTLAILHSGCTQRNLATFWLQPVYNMAAFVSCLLAAARMQP